MKNTLKINHMNHTIIMDRTFAKFAANTMSTEYAHLQQVRIDYPGYTVVQKKIKRNENKKTYCGLDYPYMEDYIMTHGTEEKRKTNLNKYHEMRLIAECHSKRFRYPVIKKWFLKEYPEIAEFGLPDSPTHEKDSINKPVLVNDSPALESAA